MDGDDQQAGVRLTAAIRTGDLAVVSQVLAAWPELAVARVHGGRTALHVVTDWPGYFPSGPQVARLLLDAGADPNALTEGTGPRETPLHWAASSDDVDVAEVLIDAGADLETPRGSIGTPLANAVGYGCWNVARLLVARGARVEHLWQAAGLGLIGRVEQLLAANPDAQMVTDAFWQACSGGQRRTAMLLLAHGAEVNGRPAMPSGPRSRPPWDRTPAATCWRVGYARTARSAAATDEVEVTIELRSADRPTLTATRYDSARRAIEAISLDSSS